jgi:chemotaxis signal transduction protein
MSVSDTGDETDDAADHVEFLLFELEMAQYAVEVGRVEQTIEVPDLARVPRAPQLVEGIASVGGDVVAVVDGRVLLGASERGEFGPPPMLLLLDHGADDPAEKLGLVVDAVGNLRSYPTDRIVPTSETDTDPPHGTPEWFRAAVRPEDPTLGTSTFVLDVERVAAAVASG